MKATSLRPTDLSVCAPPQARIEITLPDWSEPALLSKRQMIGT